MEKRSNAMTTKDWYNTTIAFISSASVNIQETHILIYWFDVLKSNTSIKLI